MLTCVRVGLPVIFALVVGVRVNDYSLYLKVKSMRENEEKAFDCS